MCSAILCTVYSVLATQFWRIYRGVEWFLLRTFAFDLSYMSGISGFSGSLVIQSIDTVLLILCPSILTGSGVTELHKMNQQISTLLYSVVSEHFGALSLVARSDDRQRRNCSGEGFDWRNPSRENISCSEFEQFHCLGLVQLYSFSILHRKSARKELGLEGTCILVCVDRRVSIIAELGSWRA